MQDATKGTNGKPVLPIKMGRSLCLASRLWQLLPLHYADPFERPGSLSATSKLRSFGRARDAWYSKRAFESGAVPVCEISRRLIGAFKKGKQRRVRVRRGADGVIGQKELAQTFVEEGGLGLDGVASKTLGNGIGIGIESGVIDAAAPGPKTGAAHFMRIGLAHDLVGKTGRAARMWRCSSP